VTYLPQAVLPHILFNDPHFPWLIDMNAANTTPDPTHKIPWLALLVFSSSELTPADNQVKPLQQTLTAAGSKTQLTQNDKLKTFGMNLFDLVHLDNQLSQPVDSGDTGTDFTTAVNTILLQNSLFDQLFAKYTDPPVVRRLSKADGSSYTTTPDLTRFGYVVHAKNVNVLSLSYTNDINEVGQFSVAVSPRTGPLSLTASTTMYAHLVSLENVSNRMSLASQKASGLSALISLYSWSYQCIPAEKVSVYDALRTLGNNVQPLRIPDALRSIPNDATPAAKWASKRIQAGYSLVRYHTRTGEETMAVQRGPLSPISVPHPLSANFPQQSDIGTDLIIVNKDFGIPDLTYQLAWQLGRTIAISDRNFVGALLRLRSEIHEESLSSAKAKLHSNFLTKSTVLNGLHDTFTTLRGAHSQLAGERQLDFTKRWQKRTLGPSPRSQLSFRQVNVQQEYSAKVTVVAPQKGASTAVQQTGHASIAIPYTELNSPVSVNYAAIMSWCLDSFFLHGIPSHYLFGDPALIPKESIRTFYLDNNWMDVFLDGALSIGNYFARDMDVIRSSIKDAFNTYLKNNLPNDMPPQIPQWGFVLRSDIVTKFPDLLVLAPWPNPQDKRVEVVKIETLDKDLLLCLFDRVPDDGSFKNGITLKPPEHQLSFELGFSLTSEALTMEWKKVYADQTITQDYSPTSVQLPRTTYNAAGMLANGVFDFDAQCLVFPHFAHEASKSQSNPSWLNNPSSNVVGPTAALVGAQLVADIPELFLSGLPNSGAVVPTPSPTPSIRQISRILRPSPMALPAPVVTPISFQGDIKTAPRAQTLPNAAKVPPVVPPPAVPHPAAPHPAAPAPVASPPLVSPPVASPPGFSPPVTMPPNDLLTQLSVRYVCGSLGTAYTQLIYLTQPNDHKIPDNPHLPANTLPSAANPIPTRVDHGFSIISKATEPGWMLEYMEVWISTGNDPSHFFTECSTGEALLQKAKAKATTLDVPTPETAKTWNWPLKPETSFSVRKIPVVRAFSRGQRYTPSTRFERNCFTAFPAYSSFEDWGWLVVRMTPNSSTGVWDVKDNYDLSFSVQDHECNWQFGTTYSVLIIEKYRSWPASAGDSSASGFARSTVTITDIRSMSDGLSGH
jgi:hypothetical protein